MANKGTVRKRNFIKGKIMIIDFHFITFFITYVVLSFVLALFYYRKKERKVTLVTILILLLYIMCLLKLTLLPIRIYDKSVLGQHSKIYFQLKPFETMKKTYQISTWKMQLVGNILLLFPIPFFYKYMKKMGEWKGGKAFLTGFMVSLIIECMQVLENVLTGYSARIFDIDDIMLNVFGVVIGILICKLLDRCKKTDTMIYAMTRKKE